MGSSNKGGWCGWFIALSVIAAVVGASAYVMMKKRGDHRGSHASSSPASGPPGASNTKYADVLKIATQFLEAQKSGKLEDNKISWRGDSGLKDGQEKKADLSKGMYDAGDHMKFGLPMAYTATVLSWSILEYGDHMDTVGQLQEITASLKWITDYLINAHPSPDILYIQVGEPDADHRCWNRPEDMNQRRPVLEVNLSFPGSDIAAETSAAMAAASLVFKKSDKGYSDSLLSHAKQLFEFADRKRARYSDTFPDVKVYYNSKGYGDELLWAATWLLHATKDESYLEYLTGQGESFAQWGSPTWFSWDNKLAGVQVLASRLTFLGDKTASFSSLQKYRRTAEAVMCGLVPGSPTATSSRTKGGLIWVNEWNSLQHPLAAAFLAVLFSDYMATSGTASFTCNAASYKPSDLRKFARSQIDYVLGENPMRMSYVVGYGERYPQYVHHRGSSIPSGDSPACKDGFKWLTNKQPNPNVAYGAVVGGPFFDETYDDSRNNSKQGEPCTYTSAVLVALLAGLSSTSSVPLSLN